VTAGPHSRYTMGVEFRTAAGIPTARRIDHFAFTVPRLDEAVDFMTRLLGGELVYRLPPLGHADDWMAEHLDVHPRASAEIALVRLGPTANVELFQYEAPDQVTRAPRPQDIGAHHFGLLVRDVDLALAHLSAETEVLDGVRTVPSGEPHAGTRWVRVLTPWGMPIELRSTPATLPYESTTAARRFPGAAHWSNREDDAPQRPAVPTALGVDHLAYTVADLDAAVAFCTEALGAKLLYRHATPDLTVDARGRALGVPGTGRARTAALRLGPTDNLELWSFEVPGALERPPRNSDVGGRHLALYVDDVDEAARYLLAVPGVAMLGTPESITEGPIAGDRWVYLRTPIGLHLELVNMPDGSLPYERTTTARRRAVRDDQWSAPA